MMRKKTHWLRNSIIILLICGIAGLALTYAQFFGNPRSTYASATIVFTFEGAADGIAPNGAAFNIDGIQSAGVLSAGLEASSLNSRYKPEDLQPCMVARGVYPEKMAEQVMDYESLLNFTANREATITEFHPTTFNIALYSDFDPSISQADLEALMKGIMTAYQSYFARVYANGLQKGNMLFTLDDYDYPQQLEIIQGHFTTLATYAQEMYERKPKFQHGGAGFNDISVRLNNLINSDIVRLNADLTMNALTRDTTRLLTQYQFEIRDLSNQLAKQNEQLTKLDELIASYDKNEIIYLSTTDNLTKIDGNSSETYDSLVDQRKEVSDGITNINSQIADYQLKLSDLLREETTAAQMTEAAKAAAGVNAEAEATPAEDAQAEATDGNGEAAQQSAAQTGTTQGEAAQTGAAQTEAAQTESAATTEAVVEMTDEEIAEAAAEAERLAKAQTIALEKNIDALVEKGDAIIDDFADMLKAFNEQEINEQTVTVTRYDYKTPKVLSFAFIKKAIRTAGPICAVGFMLCMVLIIISRKREEKSR